MKKEKNGKKQAKSAKGVSLQKAVKMGFTPEEWKRDNGKK